MWRTVLPALSVLLYLGCAKATDDSGWGNSHVLWQVITYGEMLGGVDTATIGYNPDSTIRRVGYCSFSSLAYTNFSYGPGYVCAYTMKRNGYPFIDSFRLDPSGRIIYRYLDITDNHEYNTEEYFSYSPNGELLQKVSTFPNLGITIDTYDYVWAHGDMIRQIARGRTDTSVYTYDTMRPCAPGDVQYVNAFLQTGTRRPPNKHLNTGWSYRRRDTLVYQYSFDGNGRVLSVKTMLRLETHSINDYHYY